MSAFGFRVAAALTLLSVAVSAAPGLAQQAPAQPPAPSQPAQPAPAQGPAPAQPAPSQPPPSYPGPIPAIPPVPEAVGGKPLTLAQAVALGLQQNLTLRQAALQVLVARAQVGQAQAGLQPKLSGLASYTDATVTPSPPITGAITIPGAGITNQPFTAVTQSTSNGNTWLFNLTFSYPLYSGKALEDQVAIAQSTLEATEAAYTAAAQQVVLSVRQAYYGVQLGQGTVDASQRAVAAAQENVRVTDARVRAGAAPRFDLLQAQVQLAQAQQTLTAAKTGLVQAQQNLATVLNVPLSTVTAPATPLGLAAPPPGGVDPLIQQALTNRPEMAQARANEAVAEAAIDLAASGLRPNITLTGGPGVMTSTPTSNDFITWTGTVQLTLAILDGGLTKAKVEAARQQLEQAKVTEAQTAQAVELDVRNAYLGLENAAEQLKLAQAQLDAAQEAVRIAVLRYQAGVGTQLEVVTAEQNRAAADQAVVSALYAYNLALAQLDRAIGVQVKF